MNSDFQYVFLYSSGYVLDTMFFQIGSIKGTKKIGIDPSGDFVQETSVIQRLLDNDCHRKCFVIIGPYFKKFKTKLTDYLRNMYKDCVLVCYIGDLFRVLGKAYGVSLSQFKSDFDLIISYDRIEASELGFFYRRPPLDYYHIEDMENKWDFCFIGGDKNRLDLLRDLSQRAIQRGYTCNFQVIGVPREKRITDVGIDYIDSLISFHEVLHIAANSRCIVDLIQDNAYSIDIRFIESIYYGKHYLTNCYEMFEHEEFFEYNRNTHLLTSDFNLDFVREPVVAMDIKGAKSYFSSLLFFEDLDNLLKSELNKRKNTEQ